MLCRAAGAHAGLARRHGLAGEPEAVISFVARRRGARDKECEKSERHDEQYTHGARGAELCARGLGSSWSVCVCVWCEREKSEMSEREREREREKRDERERNERER